VAKMSMQLPSDLFIRIDSEIDRLMADGGAIQNLKLRTDLVRAPLLGSELLDGKLPRLKRAP